MKDWQVSKKDTKETMPVLSSSLHIVVPPRFTDTQESLSKYKPTYFNRIQSSLA